MYISILNSIVNRVQRFFFLLTRVRNQHYFRLPVKERNDLEGDRETEWAGCFPLPSISAAPAGTGNPGNKKPWRRALLACFVTISGVVSMPGWATVSAPPVSSAQPSVTMIPLGQYTLINITWVVTSSPAPAPTYTVFSSSGQFRITNIATKTTTVLATINTPISRVVSASAQSPGTAIITEAVAVPQVVSVLASKAGMTQLAYERIFSDGTPGTAAIDANILIGGSGAGHLGVSRIALSFDDNAVVRIVPVRSKLKAVAEISIFGSGFLRGDWEAADPGSTSGTPIFRGLQMVSQGIGGTERVKVNSPELPTDSHGLHMVRLRVSDPLPGFEPPVLYYYVGEPMPGTPLAYMPMTLNSPPNRAYLDPETKFSWQPINDARAYKIEIFSSPETASSNLPDLGGSPVAEDPQVLRTALSHPPMAGMLVAGTKTQITLSASTRAKLQHQHSYYWRIQAIGQDGTVVGEAQVRELRVP